MTDKPAQSLASIVIVAHNSLPDLRPCLHSLARCTTVEHEIIVVDNASNDGLEAVISQRYPHVRLLRSERNRGFGGGGNLGARAAQGDYLVFLNPDTAVTPGWLDTLLEPLVHDASTGMTTAKIVLADDPGRINACGNDMHLSGLTLCRGMGRPAEQFCESAEVAAVSGAAFAIRSELFARLGGFDERFFMYMEDADLSLRVRLAGYRILFVPASVILHRYRLKFGPNKIFYQERNRYLMLLKAYRRRTLLILIPALLLAEAVTWGFVLGREAGQIEGKLRAYAWPWRHGRAVIEARRATQRLRGAGDRRLLAETGYWLDFAQTGQGVSVRLAAVLFTPVFRGLRALALRLVRW